jgi:hypothetical protein
MKILAALLFVMASATAYADAIGPPMFDCPKGHTQGNDHDGSWCQPPPPKCAEGEHAIPTRGGWYCQPKEPAGGCPDGSEWMSTSRADAWCNGRRTECRSSTDPDCKKTALCVKEFKRQYTGRVSGTYIEERVDSVCGKKNACASGFKCVIAKRMVLPKAAPPAPTSQPRKGALWLLPVFAAAVAIGAAFRRRRA